MSQSMIGGVVVVVVAVEMWKEPEETCTGLI
jgi:hypothetical protein